MPKRKYNYQQLKTEFFDSKFDEVKSFITDKWLTYNSERARRTKWWAKEKEELGNMVVEEALLLNAHKQAEQLEIPMETLKKAKNAAVGRVLEMLSKPKKGQKKVKLSLSDIEKVLRILKTELWEPITINKNENTNTEKIEGVRIIWSWKIEQ